MPYLIGVLKLITSKPVTVTMVVHAISMDSQHMAFAVPLILYHIRFGIYGDTNLQGLDVVTAISWPKT